MKEKVVRYRDIRNTMLSGDLVLMHGMDMESGIIESVKHSPWSHVAMVVRIDGVDTPLIWESSPLHFIRDMVLETRKSGARIVSLDERLEVGIMKKLYRGFAWRRLEVERTREMMDALRNYIEDVHSLPFPTDWELAKSYLRGRLLDEEAHYDSKFCAELIAETYMHMGLLASDHPPNRYSPKDFSSDVELPLLRNVRLSKEILFSFL
jgi:hypothetical protein